MNDFGTVVGVGVAVSVRFNDGKTIGVYDRAWFNKFPDGLVRTDRVVTS